jgi:hypothetical protein
MSTPQSVGAARLGRAREQMALIERTQPLVRPILTAVDSGRRDGSTVAEILSRVRIADEGAVREEIRDLESSWLLLGRGDGRARRYKLTAHGAVQLSNHGAFGADEPPRELPTRRQITAYLRSAFTAAVEMLDAGETDDAVAHLSIIGRQAAKHRSPTLALRAMIAMRRARGALRPGLN